MADEWNSQRLGAGKLTWWYSSCHQKLRFPMLTGKNKQLVKSAVGCALPVLQDFLLKKLPFWVQSNSTTGLMMQTLEGPCGLVKESQQNVSLQTFSMSTWGFGQDWTGNCFVYMLRIIFLGVSNTNCRHRIKHGNFGKECSMFVTSMGPYSTSRMQLMQPKPIQ